uniref:Uncharacterized protein n=1 Tax=Siphoviridae sp. cttFh17 TaxID=2826491 RepID=A0A8S5NJQ7_9CAUD|nr:MAG TPA: hypothetical protein [Siphoviridae sp. cttFh17]DAK93464.1 MAG TPA: hypothetical protein [Caudoviricetes sp.]
MLNYPVLREYLISLERFSSKIPKQDVSKII